MNMVQFESLTSNYEEGAIKITLRSSRLKIAKEKLNLILKPFPHNYDLFFNREGKLLHSIHFHDTDSNKIIYGYDTDNRLVCTFQLSSIHNVLNEINEFSYDENGRILSETCRIFLYTKNEEREEHITECIHTYNGNKEETLITTNYEGEDEYIIFDTFDNQKRLIESKTLINNEEFLSWDRYEYDEGNTLIRCLSLNEGGVTDGVSDRPPPKTKGMESAYRYSSSTLNFLKEYAFVYNEKGHWINQVVLSDGIPDHIIERTLEYY